MKLLPHYFKWIGIGSIFLGFILGIDDVRRGSLEGRGMQISDGFSQLLPDICSQLSDYPMLIGLLIYILAKNKTEDEFAQKLRYESAFIVLVITIVVLIIVYMINPGLEFSPAYLLVLQMLAYLIIRSIKRGVILGE